MRKFEYIPNYVVYLFRMFLLNVCIFMFFRLVFLVKYYSMNSTPVLSEILYALFNRGIMFDQKISCAIILLPYLILSIPYLCNISTERSKPLKIVEMFFHVYISALILMNIVLLIVDIPYFGFYNARLTKVVFNWFSTLDIVVEILLTTPIFMICIVAAIVVCVVIVKFLNKIFRVSFARQYTCYKKFGKRFWQFFGLFFLLVLGVRGEYKFDSHPYVIKDAYFSKNAFVNQLAINPIFSFFDSFRYNRIEFVEDTEKAIKIVQKDLKMQDKILAGKSPIARAIVGDKNEKKETKKFIQHIKDKYVYKKFNNIDHFKAQILNSLILYLDEQGDLQNGPFDQLYCREAT